MIVARWRETTLGELLDVKHGFAFLGQYFGDTGTHIVLTPGNFEERGGFRSKGEKEKWYAGPVPEEYVLRRGDVLVAMTEQAEGLLGSSAIVPRDGLYLHNQRLGLVRPRNADLGFLYHLFNSATVRQQIRASASGAKVRHTAPSRIGAVRVRVPDLPEQRRIAGILSAYDDLLENCERRIRLLDEMARALYREWFVLFRYPGHEKVPLVESALGPIPKGWAAATIADATSFLSRGITPKYDEAAASTVINQKCIRDLRLELAPARRQSKPIPEERRVRIGDVLINSTGVGTLGRVAQVLESLDDCTVDTHVTIARAAPNVDRTFFGLALLDLQATFERKGVGATGQTELSRTAIGETPLVLAPVDRQQAFSKCARPMREETMNLQKRAENLRKTRDLLLPRLLSGQLSVDAA